MHGMVTLRSRVLVALLAATAGSGVAAQEPADSVSLLTRAERTDFRETSSYEDVITYVEHVARVSPVVHLSTFGYTMEGRALPLVVVTAGDPNPVAVARSGKVRVFIQGNIHAGEVCGKEALQVLLRALANGEHRTWLDSLVLLIAPIYNADGNERVRLTNRRGQFGPVGGVGQRTNAQGLDLNRDHMKLESPEARSLVALMQRYDPHVLIDLHTTNGTRHAYHLTYAPPLHPDTDPAIVEVLREALLPAVTAAVGAEHGWEYYYYGNLPWPSSNAERGWYTYDHRPRYNTNYVGLRNRIGILSEAYAYASFEDRVYATLWFVEETLEWTYRHAFRVRAAVETADRRSVVGRSLSLRAAHRRSADSVTILLGEVIEERHPYSGAVMLRRTDAMVSERMPEFGTFRTTERAVAPAAYLVPGDLPAVRVKLDEHGIRWHRVARERGDRVERFLIDSTRLADREYQGHRQRELFGRYETAEVTVPAGTVVVPVDQPLGRLVFQLLEPRSDDGLVNWNVLDDVVDEAAVYPILRLPAPSPDGR